MKQRPIIHSRFQHVADRVWPVFLPIALVSAVWFVWKAKREIQK